MRSGRSCPIAWVSACAEAAVGTKVEAIRISVSSLLFIKTTSSTRRGRRQLDHVDERFEMGIGKDEPPALLADPLEQADQVALLVDPILIGLVLVAELQRAEEDQPAIEVGKQPADRALRSVELGEGEM